MEMYFGVGIPGPACMIDTEGSSEQKSVLRSLHVEISESGSGSGTPCCHRIFRDPWRAGCCDLMSWKLESWWPARGTFRYFDFALAK